jgi:hypothetical protein
MGLVASVCPPSTLRGLIWPEASKAQNNMAAVSADGSTICVLIRRLNSSCSRSMALVVRTLRHWLGGNRVKVKSRVPIREWQLLADSLIPGFGVKLSAINPCRAHCSLRGGGLPSADGVRRRWWINVASAVSLIESSQKIGRSHHRHRRIG